ncbi:MAG TPA: ABC transporter permease [Candidatus Dormibacteraeota bacterium]|jgi:oligopeptide transport system permease protein|nr:ABC transporter permease [Candidatus Dormibacteraeota bacterium]
MSTAAILEPGRPVRRQRSSFWWLAWARYRRNKLALVSGIIAIAILVIALLAPLLARYGYAQQNLGEVLAGPSLAHPLGTDELGRDMLSRMIYGARTTMTVALLVPTIGTLIGLPIGVLAGWFGGIIDFITLRLVEVFTMVPPLLLALLLIALYGSGLWHVILFLGISGWIGYARIARAQYLALRDREFVVAARALAVPNWRIMFEHILPNAAGPMIVFFIQQIPATIFAEAGYSFLGLGVQDPLADWGKMITDGEQYLQVSPLVALLPMIGIALATLSYSFFGDGLRDALDPSMSR